MKPTKKELVICVLVSIATAGLCMWVFTSRLSEGGGKPLVDKGPNKVTIYGVGGQQITASTIVFADSDGKATLTIKAGPPATLEIVDSKGKTKVIDLPKLAARAALFGNSDE